MYFKFENSDSIGVHDTAESNLSAFFENILCSGPAVIKPAEIKTFQRQTQNIPPALVELRAADRAGGKAVERTSRPVGQHHHHHPPTRLLANQSGAVSIGYQGSR